MVNSINSKQINPIQLLSATNAFKSTMKPQEKKEEPVSEGVNLSDNNKLLSKIDTQDVKKFASILGENNISDDDIKYGLTYGRSIIADWVV